MQIELLGLKPSLVGKRKLKTDKRTLTNPFPAVTTVSTSNGLVTSPPLYMIPFDRPVIYKYLETDDVQDVSVYGLLAITTPSGRHGLIFKHRVAACTPR
jgi:hypothetical protein